MEVCDIDMSFRSKPSAISYSLLIEQLWASELTAVNFKKQAL